MGVERLGNARGPRRSRRRPLPAVVPDEQRNALLLDWLGIYANDPEFRQELEQLFDTHVDTIRRVMDAGNDDEPWSSLRVAAPYVPALVDYVNALNGLVTRWKLHLLPDDVGYYAVHSFFVRRLQDGSASEAFTGPHLSRFFMFRKDLDDYFFDASFPVAFFPETDETLTIVHSDTWHTSRESQKDARDRILKEITKRLDQELDRIAVAHEEAGYVYPDTAPERRKYLRWLYMKDVLARSTKDIADAEAAGDDPRIVEEAHIDNKIRDMRKALGFPTGRNSIS